MLEKFVSGREVELSCDNLNFPAICFKCGDGATTTTFVQMRKSYLLGHGEKVLNIAIPICKDCSRGIGTKRFFWKYGNLLVAFLLAGFLWYWAFTFGESTWQRWALVFCGCLPILYLRKSHDHVFNWFALGVWGYGLKKDFSSFTLKFKNDELGRQIEPESL